MSGHWILCVDDDEKLLDGLELQLSIDYDIRVANSGRGGLQLLQANPECAVIISDMRMPSMNGAQFLAAAKEVTPDTTRMLLTGFSDITDTISAINDGGIYRFLTKPTSPDVLRTAIDEGIRQWELIQSERVLLEQTVHGAAEALVEALEIASPAAFSRARHIESASRHVASQLGLGPVWEVALAGLLLRLGWIAVPPDTVDTYLAGGELSDTETAMFDTAYATSVRLVGRIPRLDGVASIIGDTANPSGEIDAATIVRTVTEFDQLRNLGHSTANALKELDGSYPPEILTTLNTWNGANEDIIQKDIEIGSVVEGMVAEKDIFTLTGNLLVNAGTDITETIVQRLRNFATSQGIKEPITVSIRANPTNGRA